MFNPSWVMEQGRAQVKIAFIDSALSLCSFRGFTVKITAETAHIPVLLSKLFNV